MEDVDAAREFLSAKYKAHGLSANSRKGRFDFFHIATPVPIGAFNILKYGAEVEITPEPFDDFFMLEMPLCGGATLESLRRPVAQSSNEKALFVPPHARFTSTWEKDTVQLMLQVRKEAVLERWQIMCGDATRQLPKAFPEIDLRTAEGKQLKQILLLIGSKIRHLTPDQPPRLSDTPLAVAAVDAALCYFRKHQTTMVEDSASVLPANLRGTVRYIHDNLVGDLSLPVLLRQTSVSERTLFNLFRTFLHKTPRAYIEAQRLKKARGLLLDGRPVAEAARQSGFQHMGRFSGIYEKAYGEKPSATRMLNCPDPAHKSKL